MKHSKLIAVTLFIAVSVIYSASAIAHYDNNNDSRSLRARLIGLEESPAVLTAAKGEFNGNLSHDESSIDYELSYSDLQGTVTQAHIHIAQKNINGGISAWLCGSDTIPGPAGTPRCPPSGTVNGTITSANIVGPPAQGVAANEFADLVKALRKGVAYVNVHSTQSPGGEIRGQIKFVHQHNKN